MTMVFIDNIVWCALNVYIMWVGGGWLHVREASDTWSLYYYDE